MVMSRALAILLLVSFLVAAIAPICMADDEYPKIIVVQPSSENKPKAAVPCSECYKECIQTWKDHTCHFKCFWCIPLNETISGQPPSSGWQSAIQATRYSVGAVGDVVVGAINGTRDLLHLVF